MFGIVGLATCDSIMGIAKALLRDARALRGGAGDLMYRRSLAKGIAWRCAHDRKLRASAGVPALAEALCAHLDHLDHLDREIKMLDREIARSVIDALLALCLDDASAKAGAAGKNLKILAVTILTSLDRADLDACMIKDGAISDLVIERATRAFDAGADGVIASPQEAALIRSLPISAGKLIVTPGVRPTGAALGDQKRVMTPAEAIAGGADHLVIGRPITAANDPAAAAAAILAEIEGIK